MVVRTGYSLDIVFAIVFPGGLHSLIDNAACDCISARDVRIVEAFYLVRQLRQLQLFLQFPHQSGLLLLGIQLLCLFQPVELVLLCIHL